MSVVSFLVADFCFHLSGHIILCSKHKAAGFACCQSPDTLQKTARKMKNNTSTYYVYIYIYSHTQIVSFEIVIRKKKKEHMSSAVK